MQLKDHFLPQNLVQVSIKNMSGDDFDSWRSINSSTHPSCHISTNTNKENKE